MSLRDRLFPVTPENPHVLMQTEFVDTWESQFLGLGRLTQFLAVQLSLFSAADDDLGLGATFLQRHHAEVGLKLLLERVGAGLKTGHRIQDLFNACNAAFAEHARAAVWKRFGAEQGEYLRVLDDVDPSGFVYRYPVDTRECPVDRPEFVDLAAVAAAGAAFEQAVMRVVDALASDEVLELSEDELEPTVKDLAAAVSAVRSALALVDVLKSAVGDHGRQLGLPETPPTLALDGARSKAASHSALLTRLEAPLRRVLEQVAAGRPPDAADLNLAPSEG